MIGHPWLACPETGRPALEVEAVELRREDSPPRRSLEAPAPPRARPPMAASEPRGPLVWVGFLPATTRFLDIAGQNVPCVGGPARFGCAWLHSDGTVRSAPFADGAHPGVRLVDPDEARRRLTALSPRDTRGAPPPPPPPPPGPPRSPR